MNQSAQDNEIKPVYEKKLQRTLVQWLVTVLAATTLLNYGMQMGWVSPMKKVLQSENSPSGTPLTDNEMSWIASLMLLSAVVSTYVYAYIADTYGRKIGILAMIVPQMLCWAIKLSSTHTTALITARIFAGIPAGGCFNLVPMYIKEISQDNIRGTLVAFAMTFQNIGILTMYAMGGYLDYYVILWVAICVPVVSLVLFLIIAPESPAFLVKKGNLEDAAKTVAKLRGTKVDDKIVVTEMEYMKKQEEYFKSMKKMTFISIFKNKAWVRGLCLTGFIMTALDLNGTMSITAYAWNIMTRAGVTVSPELQTLLIPTIMILGSVTSATCVERFGRKPIITCGYALAAVSHACLATTLYLENHGAVTAPSWVPVLAIVGCVWAYAAHILPIIYVILAEIFPFHVRAMLISFIVMYGWGVTFLQVFYFQAISNTFGIYTTFYMFSSVNGISAVMCLIFLPETMGKTVEEIELILLGKKI